MNSTTAVEHVENIPDGASINLLTYDGDVYSDHVSAGICTSNKNVCIMLVSKAEGNKTVCVPLRDIKQIEIIN